MKNTLRFYLIFLLITLIFPGETAVPAAADNGSAPVTASQHYIPWQFTVYNRRNFKSGKQQSFSPQKVNIIENGENGWVLISTYDGEGWVYIKDDLAYRLEDYIKDNGYGISVYYENLETGYTYRHNADKVYNAASVIKAPYCLYVYNLAEQGSADLNTAHTYKNGDYIEGSGVIKNMRAGTSFTEHELLKYTIRNSDNIAFKKLTDKYGTSGFKDFISETGGNPELIRTIAGAKMTADEAAVFAKSIYEYIEGENAYGAQFKTDLLNTSFPLITADFPIARKYGWWDESFHDMAIVYSGSPYILIIMTPWEKANTAAFKGISKIVQEFNERSFVK